MIPHGVEVFVSLTPIDLRWSFDRLAGMVTERIGRPPRSGALFVFFGKRRTSLKLLFFDGTGLCQFYKRLDRGTFQLPTPTDPDSTTVEIGERELDELLDGIHLAKSPGRSRQIKKMIH